jgi:hypothetical protein
MRAISGQSQYGRPQRGLRQGRLWQSRLRQSDATARPVPNPERLVSAEETDASATEPPAHRCDRCQGPMAFVMTVFQTQVFECTQCKKAMLIPQPQRDD